ncbi:hypothetical protein [Qipengyuania sp. ASV99]|uniref:hypothetical protein n=1 Tax=Qipengyuania sp. ASV99 TaxID=3399681 RepID=UPI003A4C7418
MLPVICVLGSWSSGTTAVAGYIAKAGAWPCPPHFLINDDKSPESLESAALRARCQDVFDERTLIKVGSVRDFTAWLGPWLQEQSHIACDAGRTHIVIKHPLLSLLVRPVSECCEAKWVMVTRPLEQIEATRIRRKWPVIYGELGAKTLYPAAFSALVRLGQSHVTLSFPEFLSSPANRKATLGWLGMAPDSSQHHAAESWLR